MIGIIALGVIIIIVAAIITIIIIWKCIKNKKAKDKVTPIKKENAPKMKSDMWDDDWWNELGGGAGSSAAAKNDNTRWAQVTPKPTPKREQEDLDDVLGDWLAGFDKKS